MRLVTGVWSIFIKALSELLGSLKETSMGGIGRVYIQRKRGRKRKCSGILLNHFFVRII